MKRIILIIFLLSSYLAYGQSLSFYDIDNSDFPNLKGKFLALDNNWQQILNLSKSDLTIKEDGIERFITNISCPTPKLPDTLSAVLVIDISGSMRGPNIELAKSAAKSWIDALNTGSECAITSFDEHNYLNQDFTTDKNLLYNAIDKLSAEGGTNYDAALINQSAGGLRISKNGKHKRVIVFLTDGVPSIPPSTSEIISEANSQNCTIYCVTLKMIAPKPVIEIAQATGGEVFENITTKEEVEASYLTILQLAQGSSPCSIEWVSDTPCNSRSVNTELLINSNSKIANSKYIIPNNKVAKLIFNPLSVLFEDPIPGELNERKVIITANNADFSVTDILWNNPSFSISPKSFELKKGESIELTVSYTALDSGYAFCQFELLNQLCTTILYSKGGWQGIRPSVKTLKLTHPNGGEKFVVGSDTIITWEGVLPSDTVSLEYSFDNGKTWNLITDKASDLEYRWTNIPKPASDECLVRVIYSYITEDYNSDNIVPKVKWEKTYGGSDWDVAASIIETSDGMLAVGAYSGSNDGDIISDNKGYNDYWLYKIDPDDGELIWGKSYGGNDFEQAYTMIETIDRNYVLAGYSKSRNGDVQSGNKGEEDYWIIKVNSDNGELIWEKSYGGKTVDQATALVESYDGSVFVAGFSYSNDGDIKSNNKGNGDYWIIKLDPDNGEIIWEKAYGGSKSDQVSAIIETKDKYLIVTGWTGSDDGDVQSEKKGMVNYWVVKIDPDNGNIIWEKAYGGSIGDFANSVTKGFDGSIFVAGWTYSNNGDIQSGYKANSDYWVIKINPDNGDIIWEKTYGGYNKDVAYSIATSSDGNLIVAGATESQDGDIKSGNKGSSDYWIIKINEDDGELIWEKTFGGSAEDQARSIIETSYGNIVVAGYTYSNNGDVQSGNKGGYDAWILMMREEKMILQSDTSDAVFSIVEPKADSQDIDMLQALVGTIKDSVITEFIQNVGSWDLTVDSIYFEGADADAFSLVSGIPQYTVQANQSHFAEIRFTPNEARYYNAFILIKTQSETLRRRIRGEGIERRLSIVNKIIDFGTLELGELKDTIQVLTIKNIGSSPITINETKHNLPNNIDFSTLVGGGNFTLQPNETHEMNLRFKPSNIGRTSGTLEFHYDGVGSPEIIQLFGEAYSAGNPFIAIRAEKLSDYAGARNDFHIILDSSRYLSTVGVQSVDFDLEYNPTLISFLDYQVDIISDSLGVTSFKDIPIDEIADSTLLKIRYVAGLGNAEFCEIKITNVELNGGTIDVTTTNGRFDLLGICDEGGTRLINPWGNDYLMVISPNPSDGNVEISINLSEKGTKSLKIYDYNGALVEEFDISNNLGNINLSLNTQKYSSGLYFVHLQTPTIIKREKLIISR